MRVAGCGLCCLTAEDGVDTEEAEDQALEDSEAGEWRDPGPGQDTSGLGTLYIMEDHLLSLEIRRRYLYLTLS